MYARTLRARVAAALADTPVVLIQGRRQAGKSTLSRLLMDELHGGRYLTLDDPATLAAAHADPAGFIDGFSGPVALDEIQRAKPASSKGKYLRKISISTTMGPGVKVDVNRLRAAD